MRRRKFLQLTAATVATAPLLEACESPPPAARRPGLPEAPTPIDADAIDGGQPSPHDPARVVVDEDRFFLGVQAGAATAGSVRLWTRIAPSVDAAPLLLLVWRDLPAGEDGVVLVQQLEVAPGEEGTVAVDVSGLAPSTLYRYAFVADDGRAQRRSAIGQVRTAWAEDWEWPIVVGATTCTKYDHAPFSALEVLAAEELDLFVHCGDMVYADGSTTRAQYRGFWEQALRDPGYRALLPQVGGIYAWDDHEFDNNLDPETIDPQKLDNGRAEFFASTPMTPNERGALWQSFRWGKTLEVFVLDCRTERRPSTRTTEHPIYISDEQMAWLKDALLASPCRFKALVNSVPMTRMPELFALAGDRWQGYQAQREELLGFLEDNGVEDVWFLSGDFHLGFVGRVEPAGFHRHTYEVAVGPGGNLGNPLGFLATQDEYREQVFPAAQFFYGAGEIAATTLTFDPLRGHVRVRYLARDGAVLFDQAISKKT